MGQLRRKSAQSRPRQGSQIRPANLGRNDERLDGGREKIQSRKHESGKHEKEGKVMGHEFEEFSGNIIPAAIDVHKALGPGFLESIYQKAPEVALTHRSIQWARQKEMPVFFEGEEVGCH